MPLDWETYTNTNTNTNTNTSGWTYTVVNPEPELPTYLTYATGGYVWDAPSNFPDTAVEAVTIRDVEELRNRIAELEKQLAELKKRIGGGF